MANYANLKAAINAVIKQNGQGEITGEVMNQVLMAMVNSLGDGYLFMGVATPYTNPEVPDQNVFYLAVQAGTYSNFNSAVVPHGITILKYGGNGWSSDNLLTFDTAPNKTSENPLTNKAITIHGSAFDISELNKVNDTLATYASLSAAIAAIPTNIQRGGMTIKYIQSSDNKYVQYRYMETDSTTAATFTNVANWQGVDDEPIAGSDNLVTSGGVYASNKEMQRNRLLSGGKIVISQANADNVILTSVGSVYTVVPSTENYNGYIIPAKEGDKFAFSSSVNTVSAYNSYPKVGDHPVSYVSSVATYTVPADVSYILVSFPSSYMGTLQINITDSNDDLYRKVGRLPKFESVYDVTNGVPLTSGYYTLATAVAAVPSDYKHFGLTIKYYDGTVWNYVQYLNTNLTSAQWNNLDNWYLVYKPYIHLLGNVFKSLGNINYGYNTDYFPVLDIFTVQNTNSLDICLKSIVRISNRFTITFSNKVDDSNVALYTTQSLAQLTGIKKLRCGEKNSSGVVIDVIIDFDIIRAVPCTYNYTGAEIIQKQDTISSIQEQITGISGELSDLQTSIGDNTKAIGTKSEIYIRTDFDGVFWGAPKVYAATNRYNGIIVPLYLGAHYSWKNVYGAHNVITGVTFDNYPEVDDTGGIDVSNGFTATEGQKYLLLSFPIANVTEGVKIIVDGIGMKKVDCSLVGKKIMCLGESTTEFINDDGKGWPSYAGDYTGGTFIVGAIGGSRLSQRQEPVAVPTSATESYAALDMCNLVDAWIANDWSNVDAAVTWLKNNASDDNTSIIQSLKDNPITSVDMIVILGGGNDINSATALGDALVTNKTSILGAMNYILDKIYTANPKIKVYWASLMSGYRGKTWTTEHWSDNVVLSTYNKTEPQVIEDMQVVTKHFHVQWCDLYWTLWNEYTAKSYYTKYYGDGDDRNDPNHPWGGFDVMGRKIGSFLLANQLQP